MLSLAEKKLLSSENIPTCAKCTRHSSEKGDSEERVLPTRVRMAAAVAPLLGCSRTRREFQASILRPVPTTALTAGRAPGEIPKRHSAGRNSKVGCQEWQMRTGRAGIINPDHCWEPSRWWSGEGSCGGWELSSRPRSATSTLCSRG